MYTPEERDEVAQRLIDLLGADERVQRVELSGSGMTGYTDRWSDVDVVVRAVEGVDHRKLAEEWSARMYDCFPVVHDFRVSFGEEHVRGFLLESFLEVDIGFQPPAEEEGEWPGPDAESEAGFAWHDVLHAGAAIARGRPWRAQYYIGLLRWRTLALASDRLGLDFSEYKGVDELPQDALAAVADALPRSLEPTELHRAATAATKAFVSELRHHRPDLADRLEPHLLSFLDETA